MRDIRPDEAASPHAKLASALRPGLLLCVLPTCTTFGRGDGVGRVRGEQIALNALSADQQDPAVRLPNITTALHRGGGGCM
jgi:hypothetical protein